MNWVISPIEKKKNLSDSRSPENVADEFVWIEKNIPQAQEIFIEDDTFTVNRKRVREICQALIDRKTKIKWTCNARADVDYDTLRMMKAANCRLLWLRTKH